MKKLTIMPSNNTGLRILFGDDYRKWSWIQEQLPYTTPSYIADKIAELAYDFYTPATTSAPSPGTPTSGTSSSGTPSAGTPSSGLLIEKVVWDMFAGLGSDLIHFARKGFLVYATEISPEIYQLLQKNIVKFQLTGRILSFQEDCVKMISVINTDIIYFDPPWGASFNPDQEFDFSDISLDNGINIIDLLRRIHTEKTQNIIIKAPIRCSTFEELDFLNIVKKYIFRKHHVKFLFVRKTLS